MSIVRGNQELPSREVQFPMPEIERNKSMSVSKEQFRRLVLDSKWKDVIAAYESDIKYHKIKVNISTGGTALHVAVKVGADLETVIKPLVGAIEMHEAENHVRESESALRVRNLLGSTPLHIAASRGFLGMCKCFIGEMRERKALIEEENNNGETPLFICVLTRQTHVFVYLSHVSHRDIGDPIRNNNGDSILHYAIRRESFDLAILIIQCYPKLMDMPNNRGITPLGVLATRHSAFQSGNNFSWWKQIIYRCIYVERLNAKKEIDSYLKKVYNSRSLEQKDIKAIKSTKETNVWGVQLLEEFMKKPYESYLGSGGRPHDEDTDDDADPFITLKQMEEVMKEKLAISAEDNMQQAQEENTQKPAVETPILVAAKNGIVEIVVMLQSKIQSAIHDTTSDNENILLVAVKNRQPRVIEVLQKKLHKHHFDALILGLDKKENTMLHLAADISSKSQQTWKIAGAAMQMMWDIKWYEYIMDLVPDHFSFRNNEEDQTPGEIFKEKHEQLVKDGSDWLKETSESCSVVAALIAGVSFATSSSVPGGTEETGQPALEGQPAFDAFAISSLVGLFFSVTALIMFLSILTSRKQAEDFRRSLPLKLLFGLSSLFISIASMLISFCAGHFFVLKDKYKHILFPIYVATSLPITFYAVVQFPLYIDLVKAIFKKVPQSSIKGLLL